MTADDQLRLLMQALDIMRHYRTRSHRPAIDGWHEVTGTVNAEAVSDADDVIRQARQAGLISKEDRYG